MNAFEVSLPMVRNAGTIGDVVVQWRATVNGRPATGDLRPASGEVRFAPGETLKTLKVEVLADDVPEIEEVNVRMGFWKEKNLYRLTLKSKFVCFRS